MRKRALPQGMAGVGLSVFLVASLVGISAFQLPGEAVRVDNDDLGGVVNGPRGPEAGVWVIAETTDLPTKFARIVVTDDRGRYVVPDLPKATYNVWVRGYGLVDSPKVQAAPGKILNLTAVAAPNARAAAEYYPPSYWYSLAKVPDKSEFPGTGAQGQRHFGTNEEPGRLAQPDALRRVPSRSAPRPRGRSPRVSVRSIPRWQPGNDA